jgi:hypothetical protein
MNSIRYLVIDPDGAIEEGLASTEDEFTKAIRDHVGGEAEVERVEVDVDLAMHHARDAAPSAPVNLIAAVVVTAHWGRTPEQYTGTVIVSGGGPTGGKSASLGEDAEKYVRGLADFTRRRAGFPSETP